MPEKITDIEPGDRVTLFVREYTDLEAGTVLRVYLDATDTLVADVEVRPGDVRQQCVRFLMKVVANLSYKEQLLQRWRDADAAIRGHLRDHSVCAFPGQQWGCPDWQRLATVLDNVELRMVDARMPYPGSDVYAGTDGAELLHADMA